MQKVRQSRRDGGITALIEGFFGAAWFGWGQAAPPAWLGPWLTAGSVAALLVAIAGAVVGFTSPASTSAINNPVADRRYGIVVGVEFGLAGLGAAVLAMLGQPGYIPVWICAVVGVHFLPLSAVLRDRNLIPLGVVVTATALAALITGLVTDVAPSTITGIGAGLSLTLFGALALIGALRQPRPGETAT